MVSTITAVVRLLRFISAPLPERSFGSDSDRHDRYRDGERGRTWVSACGMSSEPIGLDHLAGVYDFQQRCLPEGPPYDATAVRADWRTAQTFTARWLSQWRPSPASRRGHETSGAMDASA